MLYINNTELTAAEDIDIIEEINGEYSLSFFLPYGTDGDIEAGAFADEDFYRDQRYRIVKIAKSISEKPGYTVTCRSIFFDAEDHFIPSFEHRNGESAADIFEDIWADVPGFTVLSSAEIIALGMEPVTTLTDFDEKDKTNPISLTEALIKATGQGEIYIDCTKKYKKIALVAEVGAQYEKLNIDVTKNADSINITTDVSQLITRLYAFGKNSIDLTSEIGKAYIDSDNITEYGIKEGYLDFSEISDTEMLLARARWQFDSDNQNRIDVPYLTIDCHFIDLSPIDSSIAVPKLGQKVEVSGHNEKRLIKIVRKPLEPFNTEVTIGQVKKDMFYFFKRFNVAAVKVESGKLDIKNKQVITEIVEVTKQEVVAADMIEATAAFIDDLQIERLETNLKNYICIPNITVVNDVPVWNNNAHTWHAKSGYGNALIRGYIRISGMTQEYIEAHLVQPVDSTAITAEELTAVKINGRQLYFTSIAGANAFTYLTFTAPRAKYPSMDTEIAEMFVVYKRKSETEYTKMEQNFVWDSTNNTYNVETVYGTGDGTGRGLYKFVKDADSGRFVYSSRTDGQQRGVKIMDDGVYCTQDGVNWFLIGEGEGDKVVIIDHAPTSEDITSEDTVFVQYDPQSLPITNSLTRGIFNVTNVYVEMPYAAPLTISPTVVTLECGSSQTFTCNYADAVWSVSGGSDSTITQNGVLTVGSSETSQELTVTAASETAPNSAEAVVTVVVPLMISPASASVSTGGTRQFTANKDNVVWSVSGTDSTIDQTGLLTVGESETAVSLVVTAAKDGETATAYVTVNSSRVYIYNAGTFGIAGNFSVQVKSNDNTAVWVEGNGVLQRNQEDAGSSSRYATYCFSNSINFAQYKSLCIHVVESEILGDNTSRHTIGVAKYSIEPTSSSRPGYSYSTQLHGSKGVIESDYTLTYTIGDSSRSWIGLTGLYGYVKIDKIWLEPR